MRKRTEYAIGDEPEGRGGHPWIKALAAILLLVALGAGGFFGYGFVETHYVEWDSTWPTVKTSPTSQEVAGAIVLFPRLGTVATYTAGALQCAGTGGFSDIREGLQVKLTADGKTLDVQSLAQGVPRQEGCRFLFTLKVPKGHKFYEVSMGRRGEFSYSWDQITAHALTLTLGDP